MLRAARQARRLSQRELAELAEVPRTTVDRIESGQVRDPGLRTVETILRAAGYQLFVADNLGRPMELDGERFRHWDRGGRHLPAHLDHRAIRSMQDQWWGWFRIAWLPDNPRENPKVPPFTYNRRYRSAPDESDERWNDAT